MVEEEDPEPVEEPEEEPVAVAPEPLAVRAPVALLEELVAVAEAEAPVPVAVALEPLAVPVAVALAPPDAVEQLTVLGTETPLAEQICWAKVMAEAWSASLQVPTRQQATLPRKSWFAQMHFGSVPQPA